MSKEAETSRSKPKSVTIIPSRKNQERNNGNVIILPKDLNQNRATKAVTGIALIVLAILAIPSGNREDSCIFFLFSSIIGLSLIVQSIPKKRLSVWNIISYTISAIFIVIFGLTILFP